MCWQGFQKKLYADLLGVISQVLTELNDELENISHPEEWLSKFTDITKNHLRAADILSSIFAYMDKTYMQYILHQNLKKILFDCYKNLIIDKLEMRIVYVFGVIIDNPEKFDVTTVADLVNALYKMNPEFIYLNPIMFQNSIPNLAIPSDFEAIRLRHQQLETKYQIEKLKYEGWKPGISQLKRSSSMIIDEDEGNSAKRIC